METTFDAIQLDVRPDLAAGREPFPKIMNAAKTLPEGKALVLLAPFEPDHLYGVLARVGFRHTSEPLVEGGWRVVFQRVEG